MKKLPKHILFLLSVYLTGIFIFAIFRIILLLTELKQIDSLTDKASLLAQAFIMGFRFDTVISGYFLAIPLILLSITSFFRWEKKWFYQTITAYILFLYSFGFLICSIDIPFFKYYFTHLTIVIFNWAGDTSFILKMIYEEFSYLVYLFVFLFFTTIFIYFISKLRTKVLYNTTYSTSQSIIKHLSVNIFFALLSAAILFLGIRGRISEKSPIRVGTAYFSNYAFPNQLGLNPVFTFVRSYLDAQKPENKYLHLMNDSTAISYVRQYFSIGSTDKYDSPIARQIITKEKPFKANIILVIMESMSAENMEHFGNKNKLTRYLDSLANLSFCFDNIYTAGIHTFNGVYSTLFSFPALMKQHPMNTAIIQEYSGFARTLKDNDYRTIYFTTHDDQFDNVGGFLHANAFENIISLKDYPSEKIMSTLGVPDDYMFEFSISKLNNLYKDGKPFFAAFLTASEHGPIIIPKDITFQPHDNDAEMQIVEYADWSIGKFIKLSSQQEWFKNTIFVFVADHGRIMDNNIYDMPLSYNHTPLIIHAPYIFPRAHHFEQVGGQIDIFPTVMGLLNINYINNTMGIDLLKEKRPCMYFCADNKIGCLDQDYYYIFRDNGIESLYKYRNSDVKNYISENGSKADNLKNYALSMMQTAQFLISNHKTGTELR